MEYGYKRKIQLPFVKTVERVRSEIEKEGLGVLTEIDVKATLKKKLGVDHENYLILGVCNPTLALKALKAEKDVGLIMPCNVIVYEENGNVYVSAMLPTAAMSMIDNPSLADIAETAEKKLKTVIDNV
ncbi:hypothetical protein A3C86_01315 [Candidatus Kaiserbacteria bacterium RIFCSPHIGHO2_02_FULL_49_16]|uniref:DUF302 domain-containing protein n=2 Tax=Parcubacteria group TaxID=1794811 RepID=A0A0G1WF56_9BACT|nr:MAG: hypothetical protein UY58_C0007G0002 [Candidatus Magasanikbacteria bacterium GW2011_GWA2_50_22]OGG59006.1 MAG: hypothetical protein A3C86_01315 [Candidatus Kaiserbacteria bacterium RIFCSPHIGHO2_02_FULL_49_16]